MDPLSRKELDERLALLIDGRYADLRGLTRKQDDGQDAQLQRRLAEADMQEVDLLDVFIHWVPDDQFGACHILLPALGLSGQASAVRLERLLRLVPDRDDGFAYHLAEVLQTRFTSEPSLAFDLVVSICSDTPIGDRACRTWAHSFAIAQPVIAAKFVMGRLGPPVQDARAVHALVAALPWRSEAVKEIIEPYQQPLLAYLVALSNTNAENAWYCIVELAQFDRAAFRLVAEALSAGVPEAASQVARSVFRIESAYYGVEAVPLNDLLRRLVELALQNKSICHNVDLALSSCLRKAPQKSFVIEQLLALGNGPEDVLQRFNLTFQSSAEDEALFRTLLTHWLLSPTASFPVIRGMLEFLYARPVRAVLDEPLFAAATPLVRTKAIRRVLGLHEEGPTLCHFAASIARMESLGDSGLYMAGDMLNFLKIEYPGATEAFLKPLCSPSCRNARGAVVFRGIYASILRWTRHLARLPRRRELRISDVDAFSLRSAQAKQHDHIQQVGEKNSVFASLVTKAHLAQGRRFVTHLADGPSQIVDLVSGGLSFELPSSELSDPMQGYIRRFKLLEQAR
ncbi:hypothetical protein [Roseateles sp. L2-2]|uniref:hypothetical protein n=1 Tax=Roseateles sp. L2-2 TaxID=3422597 RepID=UPI003D368B60